MFDPTKKKKIAFHRWLYPLQKNSRRTLEATSRRCTSLLNMLYQMKNDSETKSKKGEKKKVTVYNNTSLNRGYMLNSLYEACNDRRAEF